MGYSRVCSIILGIIFARSGQESYRQGLVFTSIKYTFMVSSIIKSRP